MTASRIEVIGKETNLLSEVEEGSVATWGEVQATYMRPRVGRWETDVLPRLSALRTEGAVQRAARQAGLSPRTIWRLKSGQAPGKGSREALLRWAEAVRMTPPSSSTAPRRKR